MSKISMRRAVLVGTIAAIVSLAIALLAAAPSALGAPAETITVVERQIDVNPGETNPCNGETGTLVDDEQDVFHLTTLADGSLRLSAHGTTAITFLPDDPAGVRLAGHETFHLTLNSLRQGSTTTLTTHVRVRGEDGSFVTVKEVSHVTVHGTDVVVDFSRTTMSCL